PRPAAKIVGGRQDALAREGDNGSRRSCCASSMGGLPCPTPRRRGQASSVSLLKFKKIEKLGQKKTASWKGATEVARRAGSMAIERSVSHAWRQQHASATIGSADYGVAVLGWASYEPALDTSERWTHKCKACLRRNLVRLGDTGCCPPSATAFGCSRPLAFF